MLQGVFIKGFALVFLRFIGSEQSKLEDVFFDIKTYFTHFPIQNVSSTDNQLVITKRYK